jgi:hypothetical protein
MLMGEMRPYSLLYGRRGSVWCINIEQAALNFHSFSQSPQSCFNIAHLIPYILDSEILLRALKRIGEHSERPKPLPEYWVHGDSTAIGGFEASMDTGTPRVANDPDRLDTQCDHCKGENCDRVGVRDMKLAK